MLHIGLLLAHQIFDLRLPATVQASIDADRPVRDLVSEARVRLSAQDVPVPGVIEKTRFRVRSRERRRDRLRYCALRLLTPTFKDCSPELPPSLSFLYYARRPLRLLWKRLKRRPEKPVI
jgi:hypothetical protein